MSKKEIIKQLAERMFGNTTESEIKKCTEFCDTLVDIFTDALIDGGKIQWKGFLSAKVVDRAARKARNPKTNEIVTFPPTKVVRFKLSEKIRDLINGK